MDVEPTWHLVFDGSRAFPPRPRVADAVVVTGVITEVQWASMGDWPMLTIRSEDGAVGAWTRDGDARRYVPGLRVRLTLAGSETRGRRLPFQSANAPKPRTPIAVAEVEQSALRSSGVWPGPGGAEWRRLGGPGTVVHWSLFRDFGSREEALKRLERHGLAVTTWNEPGAPDSQYLLRVVGPDGGRVRSVTASCGGLYDGYEVLTDFGGPEVHGPE